ncbi:MAG: MBL fold metallo-hydrolase [Candidatus Heimdallarchaeaceae archaeon]
MKNIQITAYGATNFVGRSAFTISDKDRTVMLDCGIELVPKKLSIAPKGVDAIAKNVDAFLLSHAHIDHSGYVPKLAQKGYKGKFYMTHPTKDIVFRLWLDHLKIEGERHWTEDDLDKTFNRIVTKKYHEKFKIVDGITAEFINAGHILGAAQILIDWDGQLILYSGDINDRQTPFFDGFEYPEEEVDILITESTNGDRYVPERKKIDVGFRLLSKQVAESGNKMLLPSFAVGRSQELLTTLAFDDDIDDVPIYTDGMINMMNTLTEAYLTKDWVSDRFLKELKSRKMNSPFNKENIIPINRAQSPHQFRRQIAKSKEGAIIVTTSGMLEGGPIHTYLDYCAGNENNTLGFTGYQVEGTIGRELYDGAEEITIFNDRRFNNPKKIKVKCKIMKFPYSGHSSAEGLAKYVKKINAKKVILVHGIEKNQLYLRNLIKEYSHPITLEEKKPETIRI